jgi:hypothetical protein
VVGLTIGSRGKVSGKTCEKKREEEIIIITIQLFIKEFANRKGPNTVGVGEKCTQHLENTKGR